MKAIFIVTAFLIGLFLLPQTVLADTCDQFWSSCAECMTKGQSYNCIWVDPGNTGDGACMNKDKLYGYPTGNSYLYCASGAAPQPTVAPQSTLTVNCQSITSCKACLSHEECGWCYDGCVTWVGSSSSCQLHSIPSASQCPENQAKPTTAPTVKVLPTPKPTPTPTPAPKKANGQACNANSDCQSGNCTNYVCCIKNKTCCPQSNFCAKDQYCSTKNNRYYCIPRLDNGMTCASSDQCKSDNCGKGNICCGGQPCCKIDSDCGKDEYCETKDNLYYCRVKWNVGEACQKPSACRSGYCDTYTQKCAEEPRKTTPAPKKAVCGDKSCDFWLGETCKSCPDDCNNITDFCCSQDSKYANTRDRQNKIFYLYEAPGGSVPNGRLMVPKNMDEKTYLSSYKPQICDKGKIISGECSKSDQCVKGICVDNMCTTATSDHPQTVTDKKVAEAIYYEQTEYAKEDVYINVYDRIKGQIIRSTKVEGNLEVSLEVQGATAGKVPEAKTGSTVENRLRIANNTNYSMAVIAGIVYPGLVNNNFAIEEKKYTLSLSTTGNVTLLTTIIGSTHAKKLGGQYYILPSNHQLIIYSKVVPKQEGYLDVQGLVHYSKEKMYANFSLWQMATAPVNFENSFQKSEVSNSILVTKKQCNWGICLW